MFLKLWGLKFWKSVFTLKWTWLNLKEKKMGMLTESFPVNMKIF